MAVWSAVVAIVWVVVIVTLIYVLVHPTERRCCKMPLWSTGRLHNKNSSKPASFAAWEYHDAADLYESTLGSKVALLLHRTVVLLFFAFGLLYQAFLEDEDDELRPHFFKYYTNWTYVGLGLYAFLGIIVSIRGIKGRGSSQFLQPGEEAHSTNRAPIPYDFLDKLFAAVAIAVPVAALFLTAFYWAIIHDYDEEISLLDVWKHGLNVVVLFGDLLVGFVPWTTTWIFFPFIYLFAYAVFFWIYWAISDEWVYDALDFEEPKNLGYYALLPLLVLISFWIWYLVILFRDALVGCCCSARRRKGGRDRPNEIEMRHVDSAPSYSDRQGPLRPNGHQYSAELV